MKKELSALQINILRLIICVVFIGATVYGVKLILGDSIKNVKEENVELEQQYDTLRAYIANKDTYTKDSDTKLEDCNKYLQKYNKNITAIQDLVDLDKYAKDKKIDVESPAASFSDSEFYTSDYLPDGLITVEDKDYQMYSADFSFSYSTTYEKLKEFVSSFDKYNYGLQSLNLAYDDNDNKITGQITLKQYAILDASLTQYEIDKNNPKIDNIKVGVKNIFDVRKGKKSKKK